ncbi:TonB-dependent receptor [Granulicella pectinivorans]|nr:carboxypeptidase-like regulatory domain-containing protein [Granulicella pectinivorans]
MMRWIPGTVFAAVFAAGGLSFGQNAPAVAPAAQAAAPAVATGGTIRGSAKAGAVPLPGVGITATNTLTGKKFATTTDENGSYAMTIPKNGRYVVKAELAAFASDTKEVVVNAASENGGLPVQVADFGMQLASRVAAAEATQTASTAGATGGGRRAGAANLQGRGVQSLDVTGGDASLADASAAAPTGGAQLPSLNGLSGDGGDAVAVSGQQGTTNGLASFSEDDIRQRVTDALAQARAQGQDPTQGLVGMLGQMIAGGGGFGGPGGGPGGPGGFGGGGGRGGGGGGRGGGGGGAFRNFNPSQPHGSVFYQGGNSALNSAPWSPTLLPQTNPSAYSNRFGVSLAGSPYIPHLTKPDTRQFMFINLTGQKNLNAFLPNPVRVPTLLERTGDFSQSAQSINGALVPVTLYDPATGLAIPGNKLSNGTTPISAQALALLNYYPAPNIQTTDPTAYNYQTISNAGSNNIAINTRYQRQLGQALPPGSRFGRGGGGGGRGAGGQNRNAPPVLRQNFNVAYNYSHSAQDNRNIFLPLGGSSFSDGNSLNVGYTVSYGRLSNNASVNWNRSSAAAKNYFTDTATDPSAIANINIPNRAGSISDPRFYNGLPSISITNFAGLSNATPSETINQTISFSDFVSWRHKKHNFRFGLDIRRVHADSIGGSNPLGSFSFSGYGTESPKDRDATASSSGQVTSGSGFADFLLGLPTQTKLQAGLNKIYLRDNVYDWYVTDDFRVSSNWTLNYGLRYEYFAPYTEKNNRLVNLDHNADFTVVDAVQPGGVGTYGGKYPRGLVNPDRTMYAPRFGAAWRPKFTKETVVRFGYGINYNTGQFGTFAKSLSFQPPFAATQTNVASTTISSTGCTTTSTTGAANMTLANGFGCSATTIQNNYSVNKDYRLGMVQVFNVNIQRTLPMGTVLNIGYNGAKGSNLDIVRAPNHTATAVTSNAAAFTYEDSLAGSHSNSLVVSLQKRQQKGIALGATYTYGHSIDNASSIGGSAGTTVQNDKRLDLEEGNSSFDQRHNLTGNFVYELPFGPNRAFLAKGGTMSHLLDGFSLSGTFTFGSGTYFTPSYSSSAAQLLAGGNYTLRPDRVFTQGIAGAGQLKSFFNTAAFVKPANGFGTASRNSIEGPGTISTNASLSRTVPLGDTRSFEARVTATNVFNTVQYSGINTTVNSANYGQVTSAASMRALQVQARYRF